MALHYSWPAKNGSLSVCVYILVYSYSLRSQQARQRECVNKGKHKLGHLNQHWALIHSQTTRKKTAKANSGPAQLTNTHQTHKSEQYYRKHYHQINTHTESWSAATSPGGTPLGQPCSTHTQYYSSLLKSRRHLCILCTALILLILAHGLLQGSLPPLLAHGLLQGSLPPPTSPWGHLLPPLCSSG